MFFKIFNLFTGVKTKADSLNCQRQGMLNIFQY
jgi:hypothetical protein